MVRFVSFHRSDDSWSADGKVFLADPWQFLLREHSISLRSARTFFLQVDSKLNEVFLRFGSRPCEEKDGLPVLWA
jgi:hypothetical protein